MTEKYTINLTTRDEAKAFMKFLVMERNRHMADISKPQDDINKLKYKWNIPVPAVGENVWIEV